MSDRRVPAIDILRGTVMILMVLDHTRFFLTNSPVQPEDTQDTWTALFFTRWITHFCAPLFFFLAGTSAWLSRKKDLWLRGLWLIVLELTVVGFAWSFYPGSSFAGVIWCLGWSMIVLSVLMRAPVWVSAVFGVAMIAGHDLTDGVHSDNVLWSFLHGHGAVTLPGGVAYEVVYSLIPWIGVMALGYAMGSWLGHQRRYFVVGALATAMFIVLRLTNAYGNPREFHPQPTLEKSIIDFLNTEKYPASLQFLLMTLGPALMIFAWLDHRGIRSRVIETFGRVPLFFYVLHLYVVHLLALVLPRGGLLYVWLVALTVVALLYVPCRWRWRIQQEGTPNPRTKVFVRWM